MFLQICAIAKEESTTLKSKIAHHEVQTLTNSLIDLDQEIEAQNTKIEPELLQVPSSLVKKKGG